MHPTTRPTPQDQRATGCANTLPTCLTLALAVGASLVLAACGGGGGGGDGVSTPPAGTNTLSGSVIENGAVQGAAVCLDLDGNAACGAGEPVATTDAQGHYSISGISDAQLNAGAAFVATLPAGALDAGVAVGSAHTLGAPAGKGSVISPLTALLRAGLRQGLSLATAETRSAAQTGVATTALYANYVGGNDANSVNARAAQAEIVRALKAGATLSLSGFDGSGVAEYYVQTLVYTDASNYTLRYYASNNVTDSSGQYAWYDYRVGKAAGAAMAASALYDDTQYLAASGWLSMAASLRNFGSPASPFVSNWGAHTYTGTRIDLDVSGMAIAAVVAMTQDSSVNSVVTLQGVNAASLAGTMPAGAILRRQTSTNTYAPVAYRVSDGSVGAGVTTLAGLVSHFVTPTTTPTTSNTVSMGNLHPNLDCTAGCTAERLRVAFGAGNVASYYLCDLTGTTTSNCVAAGSGSYALTTGIDGATPIATFAGLPAAADVRTSTRVFAQKDGLVWFGFQSKLDVVTRSRLNSTAFGALATQLGFAAPAVPTL